MIYLLRHASIDEAYLQKYIGWLDIGLSQKGYNEVLELKNQLGNIKFTKIYSSDLSRCKESIKHLDYKNIIYDNRLREKSFGRAEGMSFDEICYKFDIKYSDFKSFIDEIGGESIEEFCNRVYNFFAELRQEQLDNILIITHSGVIRILLMKQNKLSLEEAFSINIPYASIIKIL
jgi:broad specificity phosphatase PhoE